MKTLVFASLSALLVAAGLAATAQAQQPMMMTPYIGGDALFWEFDPDHSGNRDSTGLRVTGGVKFSPFFAVEGHLGTGGSDGRIELDSLAGAYAKGFIPLSREFRLYGLVGGTEVDFDGDRETDFSYGGGAEFDVAPRLAVGADYMRYLDKDNFNFDAVSVGARYHF